MTTTAPNRSQHPAEWAEYTEDQRRAIVGDHLERVELFLSALERHGPDSQARAELVAAAISEVEGCRLEKIKADRARDLLSQRRAAAFTILIHAGMLQAEVAALAGITATAVKNQISVKG